MKIEPVSFEDIQEGDYIVRVAKSTLDSTFFTQSGVAHERYPLAVPIYGKIEREYWQSEDKQTLAFQDTENGHPLPFIHDENLFKITR